MQKQNIQESIIIICAVFIQEGFSVCSVWQKYSHVSSFFPFLISWKVSTPAANRLQNNPDRLMRILWKSYSSSSGAVMLIMGWHITIKFHKCNLMARHVK